MSPSICTDRFPAKVLKLDNGLTIIHQEMKATPVVVVDVWVRAGARQEPDAWSGMAHFLEHMIFKGTDKLRPGQFDQIIENRGGMANAATSHDYAHFFITTAVQYLEETLLALAEILLRAAIPEAEFDRELDVVVEEIREAEDCPDSIGFQALMESMYQNHPYGRSVLGTETLLRERLPEEMRCFHRHSYQPENMGVAIVGGVGREKAVELVSRAFEEFPLRCCGHPQVKVEGKPSITEIRRQEIHLPRLEQGRIMMGWIGPGVEELESAYALDLFSVLLAEGRSSRLVRSLREELGLVQGISSDFSLQRDSSLFTISAILEPQYIERVETSILEILTEFISQPICREELARCKRLLCNDYAFSTETPGQLAGLYGYYFTIANPELSIIYPERIMKLEAEEMQQIVKKYILSDRYAITVLKPLLS